MKEAEIEEIKKLLISKRAELEARVAKLKDRIQHKDGPVAKDFAEQVVERENDEVVDKLNEVCLVEIAHIKQALQRIDEGTYGICHGCGEDIPIERLKLIPFAKMCVECAEEESSK